MTEDIMKLKTWKYEFDDAVITTVDGTVNVPKENITALYIEKDFDNAFLPITRLTVMLTQDVVYAIRKSHTSAKIRLGVKKFRSSDDQKETSTNKMLSSYMGPFEFEIYETDMTPFLVSDIAEREQKEMIGTGVEKKRPEDDNSPTNLYLICKGHSTYYRTLTNDIWRDDKGGCTYTMSDAVAHTLGNVGVPTKVLMTIPDNQKTYKEVLILPYNLLGMIKYLQRDYGLYNKGYFVFQDFDMLYILDQSIGERKVFLDPREVTKTKIDMLRTAEDINIYYGCFTFEDKYHFINCLKMPTVLDQNIDTKNLAFTAFHSASELKSGSTLVNADADTYEKKKSFKVISNRNGNEYVNNSLRHRIEIGNRVVQCILEEIDLTMIKPYFQYELVFDKQFGGSISGMYRITKQNILLTRIGDCVDAKTVCVFTSK